MVNKLHLLGFFNTIDMTISVQMKMITTSEIVRPFQLRVPDLESMDSLKKVCKKSNRKF